MIRLDFHKDPDHVWQIIEKAQGMLAFDIGANIGQSTKVMSDNFMKVIAFEPCVESFEVLCNEAPSCVVPLWGAISDHEGYVDLQETESHIQTGQLTTGAGLQWGPVVGTRRVPCFTLDAVVMDWGSPSFVKVDTEGSEVMVLKGGQRLLSNEMPELLIEVHKKENEIPLRDLLLKYHIEKLEHETLRPISEIRQNHFWLHCEAP